MVEYVLEHMKDNWLKKKEKWPKRRKREEKKLENLGKPLKKRDMKGIR